MIISIVENWGDLLGKFAASRRDIYFTEQYVKLYENEQNKAMCIVTQDGNYCLLMPFLRRDIKGGYFDFETPYGYGGFISNSDDAVKNNEAISQIIRHLADNRYVAGFVRFHPLLGNADMCREEFKVIDDRKTVAIDLRPAVEDIWMKQVHSKNRNTINKAQKRGLEFVADHDFVYMADFVRLYNATMDKLNADGFYYFDQEYYDQWLLTLRDKSFLAVVKFEGEVIASCIVMYSYPYGHYHLSGSNRDFLNLEPNNFMLWNAALELKKMGVDYFHLGGGTNGDPENSLFKFKERLSPNKYQFSFGKLVFNDDLYASLCNEWEAANPEKVETYRHHLLRYRY